MATGADTTLKMLLEAAEQDKLRLGVQIHTERCNALMLLRRILIEENISLDNVRRITTFAQSLEEITTTQGIQ
jgi:hypothetical protein